MKAVATFLLALGLVSLAAAAISVSAAPVAPMPSGISFYLNYSDPASDVVKLWTLNMTPVSSPTGNLTMSPFPDTVNLLWVRSANASANVTLTLEVKGSISNLDNTSYRMRLSTRADNTSHFVVTYVNGSTVLTSNATGFNPINISGNSTITSAGPNPTVQNRLQINVAKSLLGTISAWNIDATATQRGPTYTYEDFGWEVPGNPGSSPTPTPSPGVLPSWIWLAIVPVVLAIVAAIILVARRKKTVPPPQP